MLLKTECPRLHAANSPSVCRDFWSDPRSKGGTPISNYITATDAAINSAGGAQSWADLPELQEVMTKAVRNSRVPIFFVQAENDYDLSPSKILSGAMKDAGKTHEVKIYPPRGRFRSRSYLGLFRSHGMGR